MPAVTTELNFTTEHVLKFMIQTGRFRDTNGTISEARVQAAKAYLNTDWETLRYERWACPGFDPEKPFLEESNPGWKTDPDITAKLGKYLELRTAMEDQVATFKSGPNDEYLHGENALLMCQRVDLWCAGSKEVEAAVRHLGNLGKLFNDYEPDYPDFIKEFYPGVADL
jgi:hypothetical protein